MLNIVPGSSLKKSLGCIKKGMENVKPSWIVSSPRLMCFESGSPLKKKDLVEMEKLEREN